MIGWAVFAVFWFIGLACGDWLAEAGVLPTYRAMGFGAVWALVCWHLRAAVSQIQRGDG